MQTFESMVEEGDLILARQLLSHISQESEGAAMLIARLFACNRLGHLCMPLDEDESLFSLFLKVQNDIESVLGAGGGELLLKPVICDQKALYLHKNWVIEKTIVRLLQNLNKPASFFENIPLEGDVLEEQQKAINLAHQYPMSLLAGGPGTGKTYTAAYIVKSFLKRMPHAKVVAAAPTGKAAMQLKASFAKGQLSFIPCLTLHALLQIKKRGSKFSRSVFIDADLIIVDESSMIDAALFQHFLSSVQEGAHVVLMGDPFQLPSVGAGSVFADLVELAESDFSIPCTRLMASLRCEREEIIHLAQTILKGDPKEISAHLPLKWDREKSQHYLEKFIEDHYLPLSSLEPLEVLLSKTSQVKILTCLRQGLFGSDLLNMKIARKFFQIVPIGGLWVAPILLTESDYENELYNGEVGFLYHRKRSYDLPHLFLDKDDEVIFPARGSGKQKRLQAIAMPAFTYGYCLSVHKSQGSEYEKVLVVAPPGSEVFGREVLYTAITRVKKEIEILSSAQIVNQILTKNDKRRSRILERLKSLNLGLI